MSEANLDTLDIPIDPAVAEAHDSAMLLAVVFREHIGSATTPQVTELGDTLRAAKDRHIEALGPLALYFLSPENHHVHDRQEVIGAINGIRAIHKTAFKGLFIEILGTDKQNFDEAKTAKEETAYTAFLNNTATGQRRGTTAKKIKKATTRMLENDMAILASAKEMPVTLPRKSLALRLRKAARPNFQKLVKGIPILAVLMPGSASLASQILKHRQ